MLRLWMQCSKEEMMYWHIIINNIASHVKSLFEWPYRGKSMDLGSLNLLIKMNCNFQMSSIVSLCLFISKVFLKRFNSFKFTMKPYESCKFEYVKKGLSESFTSSMHLSVFYHQYMILMISDYRRNEERYK